jgi:hypothetical protein
MAMKRHCDRCDRETGDRDHYKIRFARYDKMHDQEIEHSARVFELCERCAQDVKNEATRELAIAAS